MMRSVLIVSLCLLLGLFVACNDAPQNSSGELANDSPQVITLPTADPVASYFLWTPEEQLVGYRNIEKIFDTRHVGAGTESTPLPRADQELHVTFDFEGEQLTVDSFMEQNIVAGLLVMKNGETVLERYQHGYSDQQRWISFSMAKSISTTLVGAAIKDGYINDIHDLLTDYIPELAGSAYNDTTIEQLLTMTTGTAWNEDYADPESDVARIKVEPSINGSDPVVSYMSRLQSEVAPGSRFQYNTGETHLLGPLLYAATGKYLSDYLSEKIWIPVGMELDSNWMLTKGGIEQAGCCLSIGLRDFARFANFFMNGAMIKGESILPEGWLNKATTPTDISQRNSMFEQFPMNGYGYMWWTLPGTAYAALGIFGQTIYSNPESGIVVVIQGAWPEALTPKKTQRNFAFIAAVETAKQD